MSLMKINVYKGFPESILNKLPEAPIIDVSFFERTNILNYDKKLRKRIDLAIMSLEDDESRWMTYEEYAFVRERVELHMDEDDLDVCIYRNNLLPDYYPIPFEIEPELLAEILNHQNNETTEQISDDCARILSIYSIHIAALSGLLGIQNSLLFSNHC